MMWLAFALGVLVGAGAISLALILWVLRSANRIEDVRR